MNDSTLYLTFAVIFGRLTRLSTSTWDVVFCGAVAIAFLVAGLWEWFA